MGALAALSVMVDGTKPLLSAAEERYVGFLFMPPTLKKLEGHIAFGLSVCVCVC